MKLNHLDLPVPDTGATAAFFERCFGFKCIFGRDDGLVVLVDEGGFALTLSAIAPDESAAYPSGFHLGFNLDSEDAVRQALERVGSSGSPIVRPLGLLGDALIFQCLAPGPVLVEVAWRAVRGRT